MWKKLEWIYEYKVFIVFLSNQKMVTLSDKVGSYNHYLQFNVSLHVKDLQALKDGVYD
jgi:hypothetical protein